jgi:hypothetical protein
MAKSSYLLDQSGVGRIRKYHRIAADRSSRKIRMKKEGYEGGGAAVRREGLLALIRKREKNVWPRSDI